MSPNKRKDAVNTNQRSTPSVAAEDQTIDGIMARAAGLILDHSHDMPAGLRQFYADLRRPDRAVRRRMPFYVLERFFEGMRYTTPEAAMWLPEQFRGRALIEVPIPTMSVLDAIEAENDANAFANLCELRYVAERTKERCDALIDAWVQQKTRTDLGLMTAHRTRPPKLFSIA